MSNRTRPKPTWRPYYYRVVALTKEGKRPFYYKTTGYPAVCSRVEQNAQIKSVLEIEEISAEAYTIASGREA